MPRSIDPAIAKHEAERLRKRQRRMARRVAILTAITPPTTAKAARHVALHASPTVFNAVVLLLESLSPVTVTTEN